MSCDYKSDTCLLWDIGKIQKKQDKIIIPLPRDNKIGHFGVFVTSTAYHFTRFHIHSLVQSWFLKPPSSVPKFILGHKNTFLGWSGLRSCSTKNKSKTRAHSLLFSHELGVRWPPSKSLPEASAVLILLLPDSFLSWVQLLIPLSKLTQFFCILHLHRMPLPILFCGTQAHLYYFPWFWTLWASSPCHSSLPPH